MQKLLLLMCSAVSVWNYAQFTSPGTGVSYNLNALAAAAPGTVLKTGNTYQMTANVTISSGDTLLMDEVATLKINGGIQMTIFGNYLTTANQVLITATDPTTIFKGIRFEETATAHFKNTILEYGGGVQVLTGNFLMENCTVRYFKSGLVTGAAVNFSRGNPVVKNSTFLENDLPAVASGANQSVALEFMNNYLSGNTKGNSNRPQINMGPSGSGGTTKIIGNTVIGNRSLSKVGGISVSSLLGITNNVQIDGNTVSDNRYGITVAGNASTGSISNNLLTDNNSENLPNNGGSGISLNGTGTTGAGLKIEKNKIRGHLWGITLIGTITADLGGGPLSSVGENVFYNNGNGGKIYALFNNTALPVSAKNNCWREGELSSYAMVENVISHYPDDPALGTVDFVPYLCGDPLASVEIKNLRQKIYPNPNRGTFTLETPQSGNVTVTDLSGKTVYRNTVHQGRNSVTLSLKPGIYLVTTVVGGKAETSKVIIQ